MKSNEKSSDLEERPMENCDKSNMFNDSNLDETIENLETSVKELKKVILKCEKCKFTTESNHGLKIHMRRKRTNLNKEKYPKDCEFCDYDCRSKDDKEFFWRKHTFKKPLVKCDHCDLVGESLLNLQVHIGKLQSWNFECGLCDYVGNTVDNLERHHLTCEVYTCKRCIESFYNLSNVKDHLKAKHDR